MLYCGEQEAFFWLDAYGLSRLAAGRYLKTLPHGHAGFFSTLSLDLAASRLLHYDASRQHLSLFSSPSLEQRRDLPPLREILSWASSLESTGIWLHPRGDTLAIWQSDLVDEDGSLRLYAYQYEDDLEAIYPLSLASLEEAHQLEGSSLPASVISFSIQERRRAEKKELPSVQVPFCSPFSMGQDGSFVAYTAQKGLLIGGIWPDAAQPPTLLWKMPLRFSSQRLTRFFAHAAYAVVASLDAVLRRLSLLIIRHDGVYRCLTLPAIGLPVHLGSHLAYLQDVESVIEMALEPLFSSPQGALPTERLPLPPQYAGAGALMGGGASLYLLHAQGDRLFDLRARRTIKRRLSQEDASFREDLRQYSERWRHRGLPAHLQILPQQYRYKEARGRWGVALDLVILGDADDLLKAYLLHASSLEMEGALAHLLAKNHLAHHGLRLQRYPLSSCIQHTLSLEEIEAFLAHLQRHEMALLEAAPFLCDLLDQRAGYDHQGASIPLHPPSLPLLATPAIPILCKAFLQALSSLSFQEKQEEIGKERGLREQGSGSEEKDAEERGLVERIAQFPSAEAAGALGSLLRLLRLEGRIALLPLLLGLLEGELCRKEEQAAFALGVAALRLARQEELTRLPLHTAFSAWLTREDLQEAPRFAIERVLEIPRHLAKLCKIK
jgi:hypothetical protein